MNNWYKFLVFPFYYSFSLLPFRVLYLFSDVLAIFLRSILYYRDRTISENLERCFHHLDSEGLHQLKREYYRHLSDLIVETIKMASIRPGQLMHRCRFEEASIALINKYCQGNSSILLVLGHTGNWEWAGLAFSLYMKVPLYVVYRPLKHENMNALMIRSRSRMGAIPVEMKYTYRSVWERKDSNSATAFLADQSPPRRSAVWVPFMDQPTPFFRGVAHMATRTGLPVIYLGIEKVKRGYYTVHARLVTDRPGEFNEEELTASHVALLEQDIRKWPACWLWSHRRWKYTSAGQ